MIQTEPSAEQVSFTGKVLQRGFWLYVWEISTSTKVLYYVGRTGDSSSPKAQSPFNRMCEHLSLNERSNVLRRLLHAQGIDPEKCNFRLVAYGPILSEAADFEDHRPLRDVIAALEKALATALTEAGYDVINKVHCRISLDENLFSKVRSVFSAEFPRLSQ